MHYYPHHIGDFIKDTANLNDHQMVTYLRMIWAYYAEEKPFPDDCEGIAFAMRSDEKTVHLLLRHYFELKDDGWHQKRCDQHIDHYHANSEKGRKAAQARWGKKDQNKQTQSTCNADAMHMHTKTDADAMVFDSNQQPITNKDIKDKNIRSAEPTMPDGFEDFWNAYGKKKGKQNAIKEWKKIKPTTELVATIVSKASAYASTTDLQYRKDPERWIKGRHWEDDVSFGFGVDNFATHDKFAGAI